VEAKMIRCALALCLIVLATAGPANAASKEEKAYAKAIAASNAATARGDHDVAVTRAREALGLIDTFEARATLARALNLAGNPDEAVVVLADLVGRAEGAEAELLGKMLGDFGASATPARVLVKSNVGGAEVYLDKRLAGKTPALLQVPPGLRTFMVGAPGHATAEDEVLVLPGASLELAFDLTAQLGTIALRTDTDGVVARIGGETFALTAGAPTSVEVPAGPVTVAFDKAGQEVSAVEVEVRAGETTEARYLGWGKLQIEGTGDAPATVRVAGEQHAMTAGGPAVDVPAGEHTVIIEAKGLYPMRGQVRIEGGKTTVVSAPAEALPDRSLEEALGWSALGTGFAVVLAAIIVDQTVDFDDQETEDAVLWSLAGAGSALTITGGILLKEVYDDTGNPETRDVDYGLRIGVAPAAGGAMFTGGFAF
jgi:hypothetical protein